MAKTLASIIAIDRVVVFTATYTYVGLIRKRGPMQSVDPIVRHGVRVTGNPDGRTMMFGHGFGGNQESWRFVAPEFERDYKVVVFDHMGSGISDVSAYDRAKYDSLHGYSDDLIEIIEALGLNDVIYVGHSVAGMMGVLAANRRPDLISTLVLVGPSPRYIDTSDYHGGFSQQAVDDLLVSLDTNYLAWTSVLAPLLMGNPERPELTEGLTASIRASNQAVTSQFARVTFLSDNRRDLPEVSVPTLVLQSSEDNIAGPEVGRYVHEHIRGSRFVLMTSRGHVPNLSDPAEVTRHITAFLG